MVLRGPASGMWPGYAINTLVYLSANNVFLYTGYGNATLHPLN